jgi:hypothetical protein
MAFFHRSKTHTMPGAQRSSSLCPQGWIAYSDKVFWGSHLWMRR